MTIPNVFEEAAKRAEEDIAEQVEIQFNRFLGDIRYALHKQVSPGSALIGEVEKLLQPVRETMSQRARLDMISRLADLARDGGA